MAFRKRALVVDDDEPIRSMLAKIVERHDLEVDTARDGAEAIERIEGDAYDVVVLDLMMPKVDGFAVLSYMKEHHPEALTSTIIASAIPPAEIFRRFDGAVYRVHSKPFDLPRLIADIEHCVDDKRAA
ncbi:MAG TPA: response regulator [Thermoanaerobaculia bacterium]